MATGFGHKRDLAETNIAATVGTVDTAITVDSASAVTPTGGWPTTALIWNRNLYPNPRDDAGREYVTITNATGDVLTATRATAPHTHAIGDVLVLVADAADWEVVYGAVNAIEGNVGQAVNTGSSPTFAALTVGTLAGIVKAAAGVLTAIAIGTANKILGVDAAGTGYEYKTVVGTTNQVAVTHGAGTITLAAPQDLHTGAGPTFNHVYLGDGSVIGAATITDAKDIILGSTTGTKIGTATTQKLGFYNKVPVVQPTALTTALTGITNSAPVTPDYAIADPVQNTGFGFSTADEMLTALNVIANLQGRVGELETKLQALGLLA